jgi:ATP-dependent Clp protease, protease subunit
MSIGRVLAWDALSLEESVQSRLLAERIVVLGSELTDEEANAVCAQLVLLAAADRHRDISLYINCPGGSVTAGMVVYDTMQYVANDIATVAIGVAASTGQFLLTAGTTGKRRALPHARIMMHQPSGGVTGSASDVAIQAEQLLHTKRTMQQTIAVHSGQPVERIERDSERERWFTAEEARDYGFVDHVIRSATEVDSEGPVS